VSQLTIRGLDKRLLRAIRDLARRERISLNKAALRLLSQGAGVGPAHRPKRIGNSLDHLFGTWSGAEAKAFHESIRPCEQIDEELWSRA